jgi:hypothetical protein
MVIREAKYFDQESFRSFVIPLLTYLYLTVHVDFGKPILTRKAIETKARKNAKGGAKDPSESLNLHYWLKAPFNR